MIELWLRIQKLTRNVASGVSGTNCFRDDLLPEPTFYATMLSSYSDGIILSRRLEYGLSVLNYLPDPGRLLNDLLLYPGMFLASNSTDTAICGVAAGLAKGCPTGSGSPPCRRRTCHIKAEIVSQDSFLILAIGTRTNHFNYLSKLILRRMASTEAKGQSWKYPLPLKQYIHGQWIDAKGTEFLTLLSAVDDTVVTKGIASFNSSLIICSQTL
jgi:hypothetical protein